MAADENEEFEFRLRAEKEAAPKSDHESNMAALEGIQPSTATPYKKPEYSALDTLRGGVEAAAATITSPANLLSGVTGGKVSGYQPTTEAGKDFTEKVGNLLDESKIPPLEIPGGIRGAPAVGKAAQQGLERASLPSLAKELSPELAQKQRVLQSAVKEGYAVPPKDAPLAGPISKAAGGISGKVKTEQAVSRQNAEVTQRILKEDVGIAEDKPLNEQTLGAVRKDAGKAYDAIKRIGTPMKSDDKFYADIKSIRGVSASLAEKYKTIGKNPEIDKIVKDLRIAEHDPEHAIELTKILRNDASKNILSDDPKVEALGKAQKKASKAIEDLVERNLAQTGKQKLLADFRAARVKIAKTYDIQSTLRPDGYADVRKLAGKADKLTGKLKTAAEFAGQFEKSTQPVGKLGGEENLGVLDYMLGVGGAVAHPALGAAVLARPLARKAITSDYVQRSLADLPMFQK